MSKTYLFAAVLVVALSTTTQAARNYDYEARAAAASALALQALAADVAPINPTPGPGPNPGPKTCLCSDQCVCGCNDGGVCDCLGQQRTVPAPVNPAVTRQWYDLGEKLPPGEYRLVGGRYYRVGEPPTISYVQPQQYAIPTQRFSYSGFAGNCGPGG